jgi:hypothetical protein
MHKSQLRELQYITPISNCVSILQHGILCHRQAEKLEHGSVAMPEIQERRCNKAVPGGRRKIHDYVNLYFCARNPMLYLRRPQHRDLCVLAVDLAVLDLPDVVLTDQNASSDYARFYPSPQGLAALDYDMIFAEYWTDNQDGFAYFRKKAAKCAEVLVPDVVPPRYIIGAYVSCDESREAVSRTCGNRLRVTVEAHLFFL